MLVLDLGESWTPDARQVIEKAAAAALTVESTAASYVTYLPVDRTGSSVWLIEDAAEAKMVVEAMIAAGVPVIHVEA